MAQLAVPPSREQVKPAFDLLVSVDYWTADSALKLMPEANGPRIEIYNGSVILSPHAGWDHQVVEVNLAYLLRKAARQAGFFAAPEVNVVFGENLFIPDVAVMRVSGADQASVNATDAEMLVEIVSTNRKKDVVDRPRTYAAAGVPWYMRVDLLRRRPGIALCKLVDGVYEPVVAQTAGTMFRMKEPFEFSIDPGDLLDE